MEKIKRSFAAKIRNLLIVVLTVSMLLFAVLYIGGTQFASNTTALRTDGLPDGAFPVGETAPTSKALYEKDLLSVAFAGIRFSGLGGGAYGSSQAAAALLAFAADPIHLCLSAPAALAETTAEAFAATAADNFLFFDLNAALPYQILYALTGEYTAAASSTVSVNADRLLLSFAKEDSVTLYLSNGKTYFSATAAYAYKSTELVTLANDSRLGDFTLTQNGIAACAASPAAQSLKLSANGKIEKAQYEALIALLGFKPSAPADGATVTLVEPQGSLRLTGTRLAFSASRDGGIPVSDLLDTAKDTLDIGVYDILVSAVRLTEQLRETLPENCGTGLSVYLKQFSHEEDVFTVLFGLADGNIPLGGDGYPYLVKYTVQNGRYRSIDLRFLLAEKSSYAGSLFPSQWQLSHILTHTDPNTLRLQYRVALLPNDGVEASWYYSGTAKEAAE